MLERLAFIKQAQALGFSLDEVKRIIDDARAGTSPCDEVREIVQRRLHELDERLREMRRYRRELAKTLAEWDRLGQAPGHICGFIEAPRSAVATQRRRLRSAGQGVTPKPVREGGRPHGNDCHTRDASERPRLRDDCHTKRRQQARARDGETYYFCSSGCKTQFDTGQTLSTPTRLMKAHTRITA